MTLKEKLLKLKDKILNGNYNTIVIEEELEETLESKKIVNNKTMEEATIDFFPKDGSWTSGCFTNSNDLKMKYLPCHLRDNKWLAKMFQEDQKLYHYTFDEIFDFIKNSSLFQEKRHNYELEIVKWQINWIKSGGEGWICKEGGDFSLLMPYCDIAFRKGVVDTLIAIGMDKEVIEEGIEKNADLWRDTFMKNAFRNQFEPVVYFGNSGIELEPVDPEHKEKWLKMRKYEYYCDHKRSVDKYGVVEPEMIISHEELKELTKYLDMKNEERINCIDQYKEQRYGYSKQYKK